MQISQRSYEDQKRCSSSARPVGGRGTLQHDTRDPSPPPAVYSLPLQDVKECTNIILHLTAAAKMETEPRALRGLVWTNEGVELSSV